MTLSLRTFEDLERRISAGDALSAEEAARLFDSSDLISIGALGEMARRAHHGDRVTYGRVCIVLANAVPAVRGEAGEVRIGGVPATIEEAAALVDTAVGLASGAPVTGFSLADLLQLAGDDHLALVDLARALAARGLEAVAEVPLDRLGDTENAIEVVRAIRHGGLGAWRLTIDTGPIDSRVALLGRAVALQHELGGLHAFAPLPRLDPPETPSTGYDDVRTVAAARLVCRAIPCIQVDWPLYGPKLAQVAIAYGADDVDAVSAVDTLNLGPRRSPREDIERQIRAAFASPAERDGRFVVHP